MEIAKRCREFSRLVLRNDGAADHVETAETLRMAADEIETLRVSLEHASTALHNISEPLLPLGDSRREPTRI